jgi:hypothetical protein
MCNRHAWPSAVLVLSLVTGCQTLSRGKTQWVPATSQPAGVRVLVDGALAGETPVSLKLTRRDIHVVRFEGEGYRPVEIWLSKKRPPLGETILTSIVWAPVGAVALGFPIYVVWTAADKPEGEWGGMGQAAISAAIGAVAGWVTGAIIDSHSPSNFDLAPQTLFVEMQKTDAPAPPRVIEMDLAEFRQVCWIRIGPSSRPY